ncbi:DDE superfamily endonuclease [Phytophthora infestans]|uniref:DDE superfamily endonuclease n=1 Tax=Phytophthora infestans TaxID=4787 RepID=A0A8S9VEH8_PHYIN|nr:DDE superfamily endonuclease [Phytophthora infestans]
MPANVQESNDRTNVSALVCVNADGGFVPPFFILPGKQIRVRDTAGGLDGSMFAASESAFLTTKLFIQYFERFVQIIPPERPVLVVADGYKYHFSSSSLQYARKHSILLYALPAHTSHFLQPLDVSVFHHFKRIAEDEKGLFQVKERRIVERSDMVAVASKALTRCLTRAYIVDGNERTGLYFLRRDKMIDGIIGDKPSQRENKVLLSANTFVTPWTRRWLERSGLDRDETRVLSINQWGIDELKAQTRKRKERSEPEKFVPGGTLMTADDISTMVAKQEEMARLKQEDKKRRQIERERRAVLVKAAKDEAAQQRMKREKVLAEKREQAELKRRETDERKLMRVEDPRFLKRCVRKYVIKLRVPGPEPSSFQVVQVDVMTV